MTVTPDPVLAQLETLSVALLGDVLDRFGLRNQVLSHRVRPLAGPERLLGRAFPVAAAADPMIRENPYEHELAAVDAVPAGGVVMLATGEFHEAAIWGELLMTRIVARGAAGAVTDGAVRDLAGLRRHTLPVYGEAVSASDSCGRISVSGYGAPVTCGGVRVEAGDLVLGDADGVVVVPAGAAAEVLDAAAAKRASEELALGVLSAGGSAAEVWERLGVL
jgi:4-hydroxy-4-methyl-2-oxoglutarate aldolase